jgi:putative ABC transport system substrate-binding protein
VTVGVWGCLGLFACATSGIADQPELAKPVIVDPPARPGAKGLLIAMPDARDFVDARKGLVAEVHKDLNVTTFIVSSTSTVEELGAAIEKASPTCVVLMNNSTLGLYQKYQAQVGNRPVPPAVVLMTSFLEEAVTRVKNITGIAYEVPGVTGFIHLRTVVTKPINRVGVVFRPAFGRFIDKQKKLAARENVELVPVAVPPDVTADQLRDSLQALASKVDALWMLNDNGLIRDGAFISDTWRAVLRDVSVPLMVGVPNLVDPAEPVGTLAVVPDHEALGLQAANLIFSLADNDWKIEDHPVELPLSVKTIVDVKQARERFGLRPDALQHVDRPLDLAP